MYSIESPEQQNDVNMFFLLTFISLDLRFKVMGHFYPKSNFLDGFSKSFNAREQLFISNVKPFFDKRKYKTIHY